MARAATSTGAESIRWDLSDLFASPTDPALEATLAKALDFARSFETRYRGKLGSLEPHDFAGMMAELEVAEETAIKPEVYAYLLHSQNTQDPGAGRLLARVREAAAERGAHGVFIALELAQISDEQAAKLFSNPESARYRHHLEEARKFRPHQLSEPE
ncbi:MAG: oligoendopeptidase, partial [Chloroflexi bacterium]